MPAQSHEIISIACIALVILACITAGCNSSPVPPPPTATTAAYGEGNTITIKNFAFTPATLTVKTGTVVTWVNNDGASHTLASDAGSPVVFSSDTLSPGASYTFTFTQPGTYTYHCTIHPSMTGTIIVQ